MMVVFSPPRTDPPMQLTEPEVRAAIAGAMTMMFLAALETTIVSTALPSIAADLGDVHLLSWVITAYLLLSTVSVPLYGKLSDSLGRKPLFQFALAAFLLGRGRALKAAGGASVRLHSLPNYYGAYAALWAGAQNALAGGGEI